MNWLDTLHQLDSAGTAHVLVTIVAVDGSAPREAGVKMVVDSKASYGTIGGGNLEYQALRTARELIDSGQSSVMQLTFTLGADLVQCCGGRVSLMFELFNPTEFRVALFGAGHVGTAVVRILTELDCRVDWFDSRPEFLPLPPVQGHIGVHTMNNAYAAVGGCLPHTLYLILTHSHEIDFELVEAVLSRGDARFCGLIASDSKAARFRSRLRRKEFTEHEIGGLTAPVGLNPGMSKQPMAVAVSIVAQLLDTLGQTVTGAEIERV